LREERNRSIGYRKWKDLPRGRKIRKLPADVSADTNAHTDNNVLTHTDNNVLTHTDNNLHAEMVIK